MDEGIMTPLLVTGMGRSGTTLIAAIINEHPDVFLSEESWEIYNAIKWALCGHPRQHMRLEKDAIEKIARKRGLLPYEIGFNNRYRGDKCPPLSCQYGDTSRIFPDMKWIWCYRHPFDVAISWLERFGLDSLKELEYYSMSKYPPAASGQEVARAIMNAWAIAISNMNKSVNRDGNGYMIKYENLCDNPNAIMALAHDWLGLTFDDRQLHSCFGKELLGGDDLFSKTTCVHAKRSYAYRDLDELSIVPLRKAASDAGIIGLAKDIGYEL